MSRELSATLGIISLSAECRGMDIVTLTIDDVKFTTQEGATVLEAAQGAGIYIPRLCLHPDLPSLRAVKADEFIYQGSKHVVH